MYSGRLDKCYDEVYDSVCFWLGKKVRKVKGMTYLICEIKNFLKWTLVIWNLAFHAMVMGWLGGPMPGQKKRKKHLKLLEIKKKLLNSIGRMIKSMF